MDFLKLLSQMARKMETFATDSICVHLTEQKYRTGFKPEAKTKGFIL